MTNLFDIFCSGPRHDAQDQRGEVAVLHLRLRGRHPEPAARAYPRRPQRISGRAPNSFWNGIEIQDRNILGLWAYT